MKIWVVLDQYPMSEKQLRDQQNLGHLKIRQTLIQNRFAP
jgi:hypothetical protein